MLAAGGQAACVANPLAAKIQQINFKNVDAIRILLSVSQGAHICFGLEGASTLRTRISISSGALGYSELLRRIAPGMRVRVAADVVNISAARGPAADWLDTPLVVQTNQPEDINWVAYWILGSQLYYRARPGLKGGIAGDIGGSGVRVGPYPRRFMPARNWLNQLIRDAGGGCWLTRSLWLKRQGPPPLNAWLVLLYRGSPDSNERALEANLF